MCFGAWVALDVDVKIGHKLRDKLRTFKHFFLNFRSKRNKKLVKDKILCIFA